MKKARQGGAKTSPNLGIETVDQHTFGSTLGQAVWLMTMSNEHRELPIKALEDLVAPAILFRQFKLYSKENQPVAFLTWAAVSPEVKAKIESGDRALTPEDWRSGSEIVVIECVSPFAPAEAIKQQFLSTAQSIIMSKQAK